jgi:hypothetical protein
LENFLFKGVVFPLNDRFLPLRAFSGLARWHG